MKKIFFKILILICLVIASYKCTSNEVESENTNNVTVGFNTTFGGSLNESFKAITKSANGGYAVLGHAQSNDGDIALKTNTSFDFWVVKYNRNNGIEWQKNFGGSGDDRGQSIVATTDGGYAILGATNSVDGDVSESFGNTDFWVVKLNARGDVSWERSFGFSGIDGGTKLIQTSNGGFLLVGVLDVTASNGQGNTKTSSAKRHAGGDYWAIKLNPNGAVEWSKFYGGSFTDTPHDVIQTSDNGFLIVGSSDSNDVDITNNKGSYDFWVVKIAPDGTKLWEKSYGGSEIDEARGIVSTGDGHYIIVGDTRSNDEDVTDNNGAADIFVIKIDNIGNVIWRKSFGGMSFDSARSISNTSDGGFIISGSSRSSDGNIATNKGQNDALVIKLDNTGNLEWQHTFGGSNIDQAFDALEINTNNIMVVGESGSADNDITINKGFNDALIYQLNKE